MKLLLVFLAVFGAAVLGMENHNPGFQMRLTQKALDEIIRTHKSIMENQWEKAQKMFKKRMTKYMKWPEGTGIFTDAKVKDIELISFSDGDGSKIQLEAPNKIKASHNGIDLKFKLTIQDAGKTGSITVNIVDINTMMGVALTKTEKGNFQFNLAGCDISVSAATVKFEGFGAEKDKKYTKKAQEKLDTFRTMLGALSCPKIEMLLTVANVALEEYNCKIKGFLPGLDDIYFSMCLMEDPSATSEYLDFKFCGATMHESELGDSRPEGYNPAPLAMSDDVTSKMIYFWDAEAMDNQFFKTLFKHDKLEMHICKDTHPKIAEKIKKRLQKMAVELGKPPIVDDATIKTMIKAEKAPVLDFDAATPNAVKGKLSVRFQHKIKNCAEMERCAEHSFYMVADIEGKLTFEIGPPDEGKVFPRIKSTAAIEKLKVVKMDPEDTLTPAMKAKVEVKAKKGFAKMLNKMLKKWADEQYENEDKFIPPYMKFFQIQDFAITILADTLEMGGSVKFDVEKINDMMSKAEPPSFW